MDIFNINLINNELCKELNEDSNYVKLIEVKYRDFKIIIWQRVIQYKTSSTHRYSVNEFCFHPLVPTSTGSSNRFSFLPRFTCEAGHLVRKAPLGEFWIHGKGSFHIRPFQ